MLVASFLSWWYGQGWRQIAGSFSSRLHSVANDFSVGQLLKTLFAPWRRIITYPGASLAERFHAGIDNLFSRMIGFVVRLFVLLAAVVSLAAVALLSIIEIIVWPLVPWAIPGFLIAGLLK